jgi:hypothetical protein
MHYLFFNSSIWHSSPLQIAGSSFFLPFGGMVLVLAAVVIVVVVVVAVNVVVAVAFLPTYFQDEN